tara:strand:+ start:1030 stop:1320 length:291 start_codon:yes stop_codon:yes gene_type:complete
VTVHHYALSDIPGAPFNPSLLLWKTPNMDSTRLIDKLPKYEQGLIEGYTMATRCGGEPLRDNAELLDLIEPYVDCKDSDGTGSEKSKLLDEIEARQ